MEQPVVSASTSVLRYDMSSGKWVELGSQAGPCNITIYKSPTNEYRFVGWKECNQEVVLNSFLFPFMVYNETTPTFHQWYDEGKNPYGLNFLDANEAKKFGIAVVSALEILNGSKVNNMGGDNISVPKKSVEKSPGYRSTNRKYSVDRPAQSNQIVSPYATTGIKQTNVSSAVKVPSVPVGKPQVSVGAPPPPGPPPAAPPPPGPPPPGLAPAAPSVPSIKKPAVNDFASQLKAASQTMKPSLTNSNAENVSRGSPTPPAQTTQPVSSKPPPQMDFLSELKFKSQKRTDGINSTKKTEPPRTSLTPTVNVPAISSTNQPAKLPSSNSDLTTFVTSADLEKFRTELLQDIISNMGKFKEDIINGIISRLN